MTKEINGDVYSDLITRADPNMMPSSSRAGAKIEYIVIHHMATTNFQTGISTWYGGSTSANYAVNDSEIVGCVGENYAAWHAGGIGANDIPNILNINARSIGIEHVNSNGAPDWQVSDATIKNSARLVADLCQRYGIPVDRKHILRHGEITKTQCCGGLNVDILVKYVQEILNPATQPNQEEFIMTDGLFKIIDDHAGYKKDDYVYWSTLGGFKRLSDPAEITLLKQFNPAIKEVVSGSKGPWVARAAYINGTNYGKR
ncbi:MAG: N-acetylmuramoyl-L-alanine amidase [Streptococcaceae bacterium]|jgi:hypothetical protein|nr:N-acetylmuramoyl-L-alanine amidase [Streptococcaceae bacterium]